MRKTIIDIATHAGFIFIGTAAFYAIADPPMWAAIMFASLLVFLFEK